MIFTNLPDRYVLNGNPMEFTFNGAMPNINGITETQFKAQRVGRSEYVLKIANYNEVTQKHSHNSAIYHSVARIISNEIREKLETMDNTNFMRDLYFSILTGFLIGNLSTSYIKVNGAKKFNQLLKFLNEMIPHVVTRYADMKIPCPVCGCETDKDICDSCVTNGAYKCDICDSYHSVGNKKVVMLNSGRAVTICGSCFDKQFYECPKCKSGNKLQQICSCGFDRILLSYNYKPTPKFYGDGLFMGVEIETECPKGSNRQLIINEIADTEHFYFKSDGSLEHGIEFVSNPCTYEYHKEYTLSMLDKLVGLGLRADDTNTCGLHVHVGKAQLGDTKEQQDEVIKPLIYLLDKNWSDMIKFTRRKPSAINRWSQNYMSDFKQIASTKINVTDVLLNDVKIDRPFMIDDIYKTISSNRHRKYKSVNISPTNTIEFRVFQGTIDKQTFLATLEFVETLIEYCKHHTIKDIVLENKPLFELLEVKKESALDYYLQSVGLK